MTARPHLLKTGCVAACAGLLVACSTVDKPVEKMANLFTPYRVELIQGNVVTREQLSILRPGFTRQQVKDILGTPLISSLFHADRWDYAFTIKRQGAQAQQRKLSVFFENNLMARVEADEMPSEAEFAAGIDVRKPARPKCLAWRRPPKSCRFSSPPKCSSPSCPLPPRPWTIRRWKVRLADSGDFS